MVGSPFEDTGHRAGFPSTSPEAWQSELVRGTVQSPGDPEAQSRSRDMGAFQWAIIRHAAELRFPYRSNTHTEAFINMVERLGSERPGHIHCLERLLRETSARSLPVTGYRPFELKKRSQAYATLGQETETARLSFRLASKG